jgi:hypothetical protein
MHIEKKFKGGWNLKKNQFKKLSKTKRIKRIGIKYDR